MTVRDDETFSASVIVLHFTHVLLFNHLYFIPFFNFPVSCLLSRNLILLITAFQIFKISYIVKNHFVTFIL